MKKNFLLWFSIAFCITSAGFALFCLLQSSPYRILRPYSLYSGENIAGDNLTRIGENRSHQEILIQDSQSVPQFDSYWMDQIPVTVADYKQCVQRGKCVAPHYIESLRRYYDHLLSGILPITFVTWQEARTYCAESGGDLPTEQQWETAAGHRSGKTYPWGEAEPSPAYANYDEYFGGITPAGWLPRGASIYGVLDLAGNVREWVLDVHYPEKDGLTVADKRSPAEISAEATEDRTHGRILKGGGAFDSVSNLRNVNHLGHSPVSPGFNRGFRCVYPVASSDGTN